MFSSTGITSSSVKTVCEVHNRDVCNKGAMCFMCVYGVWFLPPTLFFAQHCAAAASVSCAPVLPLSLPPVFFFFFLSFLSFIALRTPSPFRVALRARERKKDLDLLLFFSCCF